MLRDWCGVFREKPHISSEFSYKTIERGYDPGSVTEILEEVFHITNEMDIGTKMNRKNKSQGSEDFHGR